MRIVIGGQEYAISIGSFLSYLTRVFKTYTPENRPAVEDTAAKERYREEDLMGGPVGTRRQRYLVPGDHTNHNE